MLYKWQLYQLYSYRMVAIDIFHICRSLNMVISGSQFQFKYSLSKIQYSLDFQAVLTKLQPETDLLYH